MAKIGQLVALLASLALVAAACGGSDSANAPTDAPSDISAPDETGQTEATVEDDPTEAEQTAAADEDELTAIPSSSRSSTPPSSPRRISGWPSR
jgi:ABC-type glycerol-3-phosphate transport system substrate-binding protein